MPIYNIPEAIIMRIQKARGKASESSLKLQKERLDICDSCSSNDKLKFLGFRLDKCTECDCILELKTLVNTEECKIKKW